VRFELPGAPRGKGTIRARVVTTKDGASFASTYTDAETRSYEGMLRFAGDRAMKDAGFFAPFDCPLQVLVTAVFPIPASARKKWQIEADADWHRPTKKPDWENIAKTLDGVNGVVWRDDALIVDGRVLKLYGDKPFLRVEVWRWSPLLV
jgi:Holliday junction resolvase RusA-like endonuclease